MNKSISLPKIRPPESLRLMTKYRINGNQIIQPESADPYRSKRVWDQRQSLESGIKKRSHSMKAIKFQVIPNSAKFKELGTVVQRRFSLRQNGKITKVTQSLSTSKTSNLQYKPSFSGRQDHKLVSKIKKELNQVSSSALILKKQIRAMQGMISQIKQQANILERGDDKEGNNLKERKIEQIKTKTQSLKYYQDVLRNMKLRLKEVLIHYGKVTNEKRQGLDCLQKRNLVLVQQTAFRQESINKRMVMVRKLQQKQKIAIKLITISVEQYQKNLRTSIDKIHLNPNALDEGQYHYEIHKKDQLKLIKQLQTNMFLSKILQWRWSQYSLKYQQVQKAYKLMEMHSLQKNYQLFDPCKIYFSSFQNRNMLQSKIKQKQQLLSHKMNRNAELRKQWRNVQFQQIDEQLQIIDGTAIEIKTGKIQLKQVLQVEHRQRLIEMRKKLEMFKQRASKISRIKDWVYKIQQIVGRKVSNKSTLQDRLLSIIQTVQHESKIVKQNKPKA